jgi:glucose/arabinose dehydrogenase
MDKEGNLLVVESRKGISVHTLGADGCVVQSKLLVNQTDLNHGIQVTPDGKTLLARYVFNSVDELVLIRANSSIETVFAWTYDSSALTVSNRKTLITGMRFSNGDHPTRTLLIPSKNPSVLVVSRGSTGNLDMESFLPSTGRAIVKTYNLTQLLAGNSSVDYVSGGKVFGYGLRNDVGLDEDRKGDVWSVENSADNIQRIVSVDGRQQTSDVHNDNPAEPFWNLGDPANPSGELSLL